jgi:hypothetical protein
MLCVLRAEQRRAGQSIPDEHSRAYLFGDLATADLALADGHPLVGPGVVHVE